MEPLNPILEEQDNHVQEVKTSEMKPILNARNIAEPRKKEEKTIPEDYFKKEGEQQLETLRYQRPVERIKQVSSSVQEAGSC